MALSRSLMDMVMLIPPLLAMALCNRNAPCSRSLSVFPQMAQPCIGPRRHSVLIEGLTLTFRIGRWCQGFRAVHRIVKAIYDDRR